VNLCINGFFYQSVSTIFKNFGGYMQRLYTVTEIAKLIGVTVETIKNWESSGLIPKAARIGRQKKRVWGPTKTQQILEFAKDNGYPVKDNLLNSEVK
jgi:transposase